MSAMNVGNSPKQGWGSMSFSVMHSPTVIKNISPPSVTNNKVDELDAARQFSSLLVSLGYKLICVDFDKTLVRVHTEGWWDRSVCELRRYVRESFLTLLPVALEAGLHVAVVTFSPQTDLVRHLLLLMFGPAVANAISVSGRDGYLEGAVEEWSRWGLDGVTLEGKVPQIAKVAVDIRANSRREIRPSNVLLIDDDPENIRCAQQFKIASFLFTEEISSCRALLRKANASLRSPLEQLSANSLSRPSRTPGKCSPQEAMNGKQNSQSRTPVSYKTGNREYGAVIPLPFCTPSPIVKPPRQPPKPQSRISRKSHRAKCSRSMEDALTNLHIT